jgi:Protein of unknown function (DUF2917)
MNRSLMKSTHQTEPWSWAVEGATELPAARQARWLAVSDGRVWLTRSHQRAAQPCMGEDIWLDAGQRHALPAGSTWVIEAWPQAQVALLQAPPPHDAAAVRRQAVWRVWRDWLKLAFGEPRACSA